MALYSAIAGGEPGHRLVLDTLLWSQIHLRNGWRPLAGVGLALLGAFLICWLLHNLAIEYKTQWFDGRRPITLLQMGLNSPRLSAGALGLLGSSAAHRSAAFISSDWQNIVWNSSDRNTAQLQQPTAQKKKKSLSRTCPSKPASKTNFLSFPCAKAVAVRKLL